MNNRIKMTDSKFKCNIILFLSVTVFMARLSIYPLSRIHNTSLISTYFYFSLDSRECKCYILVYGVVILLNHNHSSSIGIL
jgi:hypothetical protein